MNKQKFENITYSGAAVYEHTEAWDGESTHITTLYVAGECVAVREIVNGVENYYVPKD